MALPIKQTIYSIYIIVLVALGALLSQGIRQHQLYQEHESIISQTESLIFQFSIIREHVSDSLLDSQQTKLSGISSEMEKLNSNLSTILSNQSIGDEYKLTFLNSIDLPGIILLLRKIESGDASLENMRNLNQEMRALGERLILFDRVLVNNAKQKLIGFQNIIIGSASLIVFLLVIVLALFHRNLIIPLFELVRQSSLALFDREKSVSLSTPSQELNKLVDSVSELLNQRSDLTKQLSDCQETATDVILSLKGIWAQFSKDGKILQIHDEIAEQLGIDKENFLGRDWQDFFKIQTPSLAEIKNHENSLLYLSSEKKAVDVLLKARDTGDNGSEKHLRCCFIQALAGSSYPGSIYCLGIDFSAEQKKIIQLQQNLREEKNKKAEMVRVSHLAILGEMSTGIAHEVSNLSNGIINYAQVLADGACDPDFEIERDKLFHKIIIEGEKIAGLAKNLLAYGQDDAASREIAKIDDILQNSLELMGHYFRIDGTTIDTDLANMPLCKSNGRQIQQVFLSILNNARRALNERYPQKHDRKILKIKAEKDGDTGSNFLKMTFTDYGTGIAEEHKEKVFDPSFSTKPSTEGVGMGLTVSRQLVEMNGGTIALQSKKDEFTTVTVKLPLS